MEMASIETLFHEKLMLYRELTETLKEEKEWIVHADVDALWRISEKKQAVSADIEDARGRILDALCVAGIEHGMTVQDFQTSRILSLVPVDLKKRLMGAQVAIATLKEEIRAISGENKHYIESYLSMLDDLMTILTGTDRQPRMYQPDRTVSASGGVQVLHREV